MTGWGFWTLKPLGVWGSECGATWNSGPSVATRAVDPTGGRGDYTTEGGGAHGQGAVRLPSLKFHPEGYEQCLRFLRTSDQGTPVRTDGMMPDRRQMCWWTRLLGCNRTWRSSDHNDESAAVWWDDQLGTVPTGF